MHGRTETKLRLSETTKAIDNSLPLEMSFKEEEEEEAKKRHKALTMNNNKMLSKMKRVNESRAHVKHVSLQFSRSQRILHVCQYANDSHLSM